MIFADLIVLSDWVIAVGKCCCLLVCWGRALYRHLFHARQYEEDRVRLGTDAMHI